MGKYYPIVVFGSLPYPKEVQYLVINRLKSKVGVDRLRVRWTVLLPRHTGFHTVVILLFTTTTPHYSRRSTPPPPPSVRPLYPDPSRTPWE